MPRKGQSLLVLTRKTNQSIMIGDDVEITILSVTGDKVRIGIEAPREIGIYRREVYESRNGEQPAAAEAGSAPAADGQGGRSRRGSAADE